MGISELGLCWDRLSFKPSVPLAFANLLLLILIFGLENIVLVWPSPYPALTVSSPPSPGKKYTPPTLAPFSVAQTPAQPLSQPPTPGSRALAGLEWLEESWGASGRSVCSSDSSHSRLSRLSLREGPGVEGRGESLGHQLWGREASWRAEGSVCFSSQ